MTEWDTTWGRLHAGLVRLVDVATNSVHRERLLIRAGARAAYQASLEIRARLAAADPGNAGWQHDLSVSV
jgi:hypothetical protein